MLRKRKTFEAVFNTFRSIGFSAEEIVVDCFRILDDIKRVKDSCSDDIDFQLSVIAQILAYDPYDPSTWIFDPEVYEALLIEFPETGDAVAFILEVGKILFKLEENFGKLSEEEKQRFDLIKPICTKKGKFKEVYRKLENLDPEEIIEKVKKPLDILLQKC